MALLFFCRLLQTQIMSERFADVGAVVIGRNEGERLKRCLMSLSSIGAVIYVDSGSSDGSIQWAAVNGASIVELDMSSPFTAARARNEGFRRLRDLAPEISIVQFVDGDCEIDRNWIEAGRTFLMSCTEIGAVCGKVRERQPDRSIYNWLRNHEWNEPAGEISRCAGTAMMRVDAFAEVGAFRDDLIAGEDPELCVRLRAAGWRIWRLEADMAFHDAAMVRFSQWWKRTVRSGHAFAEVAYLHGTNPERFWIWECRRAWLWGFWLPFTCLLITLAFWPWGCAAWLIYPAQTVRQMARNHGPPGHRAIIAVFQVVARFPEAIGQMKFMCNRLVGRRSRLIEYK